MEIADSRGSSNETSPVDSEASSKQLDESDSSEVEETLDEYEVTDQSSFELTEAEKEQFSVPSSSSEAGALRPVGRDNVGFFGIMSSGNHVGYLIDKSLSMQGDRFRLAQNELISSLEKLEPPQRFSIYFYDMTSQFRPEHVNTVATKTNISAAKRWIRQIVTEGGTQPDDAIQDAVAAECDVIFLLSDGEFSTTGSQVSRINSNDIPIHTISLETDSSALKDVAKQNDGQYRRVR